MGRLAWVTLATNDSYCLGALVLAHSLRKVGTQQEFAVLITPGVSDSMRDKLSQVFNVVQEVNILDSKDETNLLLLKRPELGVTFTKLHCWRLTQYEKCVFLDADTLVVKNCDELFEREELSAAPDVGWPDCFNSGVFVYRPSLETFESIVKFASEKGSFDGGDQGLLNLYFSGWAHQDISKHLPFIYNMCSTACYSYMPAFKQFGENVKIIHFIGTAKPWLQPFDTETCTVHPTPGYEHLRGLLQAWWDLFCACVHSALSSDMAGLAGAFAQMTLGAPRSGEQSALEDHFRRQSWEVGNIDYMGRDSFANIWQKICTTLSGPTPPPAPQPQQVIEEAPIQAQVETKLDAPKPPETQATGVCTPDASSGEEKQIPTPAQTEETATAPTETPAQPHEPVPVSEQPESKSEVPQPESKTSEAAVQEPTQPETAKQTSSEDTQGSESAKLIETEPIKTPVSDKSDTTAVEPIQEQLITPMASSESEKTPTAKQEISVAELVIEPKAATPSETEKVPESPVSQEMKTPESANAPESEKTPEPVKTPESEKVPEPVKAPEPEKVPEPAKAPEPEKAPEPAKVPEPEKAPEPAKVPEPEKTSEAEKSPEPIKTEPVQATEPMKHSAPKESEIKKELVQTPAPEVKDQSVALQQSEQTEEKSAVVKPVEVAKKVSDSTESEPKSKTKPTKSKSIETVEPEKPIEEKTTESAAPKEQQKKKGGKKEQKQISKSEDSSTGPGVTVQPATPVEAPAQKPIEESGQLKEPAVEPLQTPPVSASKSKEDVSTKKQAPAKPETPTETGAECPLPPPRKEKKPAAGAAVKKTQQPKAKK